MICGEHGQSDENEIQLQREYISFIQCSLFNVYLASIRKGWVASFETVKLSREWRRYCCFIVAFSSQSSRHIVGYITIIEKLLYREHSIIFTKCFTPNEIQFHLRIICCFQASILIRIKMSTIINNFNSHF